jgi:AraC family transcriptional regulator, regulatory protein of adaptative response / methylphosphotriester-DNA alkyltransferase methyltransferase
MESGIESEDYRPGYKYYTMNELRMMDNIIEKIKNASARKKEIVSQFMLELDKHIDELKTGQAEKSLELNEIAERLFIAPNHMSDTVKEVLGKSTCEIYENKLVEITKEMLRNSNKPINEIARTLDYDPSNFTKFFKHFTGLTPSQYRKQESSPLLS